MVEVLYSRYLVPFHCHLPVLEHFKFSSYVLRSAKDRTLQEVDKILEKGALELVDCLGSSYSQLLLVQKTSGVCSNCRV